MRAALYEVYSEGVGASRRPGKCVEGGTMYCVYRRQGNDKQLRL